jgi:hypothetical protein
MSCGFFTIAQRNEETDYVKLAYCAALSLKLSQEKSNMTVAVTPGTTYPEKYKEVFDNIYELPGSDMAATESWKMSNEWKIYQMLPYERVIKIDADMLFFNNINWDDFNNETILFCTQPVTYRNDIITSTHYRETFVKNKLPNIYSALTYFKKSDVTQLFFNLLEKIYQNWEYYSIRLLPYVSQVKPTTDVAYAMAAKLLDLNMGNPYKLRFTHMKTNCQNWHHYGHEDWQGYVPTFFTNELDLYVGPYKQTLPFHYYVKTFVTDDLIKSYEKKLGL